MKKRKTTKSIKPHKHIELESYDYRDQKRVNNPSVGLVTAQTDKTSGKTNKQKPVIDAEAFMKFFEETTGVKFVDVETGKPALSILAAQKSEKKSDYDLWLEKQDEKTKIAHKMEEL